MTVVNHAVNSVENENEGKKVDLRMTLLKQLPTSIQSASRKERQTLFSELTIELVLSHKPWEEPIKGEHFFFFFCQKL